MRFERWSCRIARGTRKVAELDWKRRQLMENQE